MIIRLVMHLTAESAQLVGFAFAPTHHPLPQLALRSPDPLTETQFALAGRYAPALAKSDGKHIYWRS